MSSLMRLSALRLFELTERRFALVRDGCFLALTVVLPVATIILAWHGAPWPVSGSTGTLSALSAFKVRRAGEA
jgi:hypothetical protein